MITIQAYRASIGSFCPKAQRHTQLSELEDLSGSYKGYTFTNHNAEQIYFLKAFVSFLIVVILYLNMNLAIFKLKVILDHAHISYKNLFKAPFIKHILNLVKHLESSVRVILFLLYVGRL